MYGAELSRETRRAVLYCWKSFASVKIQVHLVNEPLLLEINVHCRYEREINRANRSAIRKILERDEAESRYMILCVAAIKHYGSDEFPGTKTFSARRRN